MTLLLAFFIAAQPPAITAAGAQHSAALDRNGDNAQTIQSFLDSLPEGVAVTIPAGTWTIHSMLMVRKKLTIEGPVGGSATLKLICVDQPNIDVVRVRSLKDGPVAGVTFRRLTFDASGSTGSGVHNCVDAYGDDFTMQQCKLVGSHHEGITASGHRALIEDCEADNCGNGSAWYGPRSTAAFNCYNRKLIYRRCKTRRCGQGFEIGGFDSVMEDCVAEEPGTATPSIGINIGSDVFGVSNLLITRCTVKDYAQGAQCGNGVGRFANVRIVKCLFDNAPVSLEGGMPGNRATDPAYPPGPDTGESRVEDCTFIVRRTSGGALAINTGPAVEDIDPDPVKVVHPRGREKWKWIGNHFYFAAGVDYSNNCPLVILGNQTGAVAIEDNILFGLITPPAWGDIATISSNKNRVVAGQPGLTMKGNLVFKADGTQREAVVKIEGAAR